MTEFETDYLAHHGIKGQKWGVRRTPEELGHKTKSVKKAKTNLVKKAVDSYKKNRENDKADSHERVKKYIRKHPSKIVRYGQTLTKEEANDLIKQIEFDRKLKSIRDEEIQGGWKKVQNAANNLNTISNLLTYSKNVYNTTAEIHNALIDSGHAKGKRWVRVGGNQDKSNK